MKCSRILIGLRNFKTADSAQPRNLLNFPAIYQPKKKIEVTIEGGQPPSLVKEGNLPGFNSLWPIGNSLTLYTLKRPYEPGGYP